MYFDEKKFKQFQQKRTNIDALRKEITDFMKMVSGFYPLADCTILEFGECGDRVLFKPTHPQVDWIIQMVIDSKHVTVSAKNLKPNILASVREVLPQILSALSVAHDRGETFVADIMNFEEQL